MTRRRTAPQIPWGWHSMWIIAMFDLPTDTPGARKAYAQFRNDLLKDGFTMMQYSVYVRHCASIENAKVHAVRMGKRVPSAGEVIFLTITDKQFERIEIYAGKNQERPPPPPAQLEFF